MNDVLNVTEQQLMHRRAWIPKELSTAYWADGTFDPISRIASASGLDDDQQQTMTVLAELFMIGFIRSDLLSNELARTLSVSVAIADRLAIELNQQIFAPYKVIIDRVYAPPGRVPSSSPIFSDAGTDAEDYLRSAFELMAYALKPNELNSTTARIRQDLPRLHQIYGNLHPIQLAWRAIEKSAGFDRTEVIIFVSDSVYYDLPDVRRMILAASHSLHVPVRSEATPEAARSGCTLLCALLIMTMGVMYSMFAGN
jgi:hypothetical protein